MSPYESLSLLSDMESQDGDAAEANTCCCLRGKPFCCGCCGAKVPFWACCAGYCLIVYSCIGVGVFFIHHYLFFPSWLLTGEHPALDPASFEVFEFEAARSDRRLLYGVAENADNAGLQTVAFGGNGMEMYGTAELCSTGFTPTFLELAPSRFRRCPCPASAGCTSRRCGASCYSTSYRGYAPNSGWTSRSAATSDGRDLVDYALRRANGTGGGRVLLAAWSLGCAAALQVAAANPDRVAGLLLLAPFASLGEETRAAIAAAAGGLGLAALFPWLWIMNLDPWDSLAAARSLPREVPVAVVSPLEDELILPRQHRAVFDASRAELRALVEVGGAGHNFVAAMLDAAARDDTNPAGSSMHEWADAVLERTRGIAN